MDSYEKILTELVTRTQNRTVSWSQTEVKNQYEIKLGSGKIVIDYFSPHYTRISGNETYTIVFYNSRNEEIMRLGASDTATKAYQLYNSLWSAIEDARYNRPETLDSMLKELDLK